MGNSQMKTPILIHTDRAKKIAATLFELGSVARIARLYRVAEGCASRPVGQQIAHPCGEQQQLVAKTFKSQRSGFST
jgi:hypothetical protein